MRRAATESARPIVVSLVHGTWGRNSDWPKKGSQFRKRLESRLAPYLVDIDSVKWSGANTHRARRSAAAKIARRVRKCSVKYPDARHIIVGHSHGGTAAIYATASDQVRALVAGVACLSTPFLYCRPRHLVTAWRWLTKSVQNVSFLLLAAAWNWGLAGNLIIEISKWIADAVFGIPAAEGSDARDLLSFLFWIVLTIAGLLTGLLVSKLGLWLQGLARKLRHVAQRYAIKFCRDADTGSRVVTPLLVITPSKDEVLRWLGAVRRRHNALYDLIRNSLFYLIAGAFVCVIIWWLYDTTLVYNALQIDPDACKKIGRGAGPYAVRGCVMQESKLLTSVAVFLMVTITALPFALIGTSLFAGATQLLFAAFSGVALGNPAVFGRTIAPWRHFLVDIRVDPVPTARRGSPAVIQMDFSTLDTEPSPELLWHSRPHASTRVADAVADWIGGLDGS